MNINENWALFIERTEVKWTFGNINLEFQNIVSNFVIGLGNLGEELFGEGIASINFDLRKFSGFKASEIFIVTLQDQFILLISDPSTTLLLIDSQGGIPDDIKEMMTAVLVGQASILYANMISEVDQDRKNLVEKLFQDIILDINDSYLKEEILQTIVGRSGSNFSILTFEECLLLHYYLRKYAVPASEYLTPSGWCLISHTGGGEVPFSFNIDDDLVISGYFSAIIGFIHSLFDSKPKSIAFGSTQIRRVRFVYGKQYFMAIDASFMIDLLIKRQFQKEFFETSYKIIKDMSVGIKELIIEEIQIYNEQKMTQLSAESLLENYIGEGTEDLKLSFGDGDENIGLLREERKNQVLRVWGRFLSNL
ncbi:MAG: hypothetical protein ACXAC8_10805 [Candidatus Hodarchaeales archaeon]|jgi:hypothetical protein